MSPFHYLPFFISSVVLSLFLFLSLFSFLFFLSSPFLCFSLLTFLLIPFYLILFSFLLFYMKTSYLLSLHIYYIYNVRCIFGCVSIFCFSVFKIYFFNSFNCLFISSAFIFSGCCKMGPIGSASLNVFKNSIF